MNRMNPFLHLGLPLLLLLACSLFSCQKNPPAPDYSGCDSVRLGLLKPSTRDSIRLASCFKLSGCDSVRLGIIQMSHADSIRLSDCLVLSLADSLNLFPEKVLSNGLVAYYAFNGNVNDSSGHGHNGIIRAGTNGSISFSSDRFGKANAAILFNSNPAGNYLGPYVDIPNSPEISFSNSFSINYFINVNHLCQIGEIINKGSDVFMSYINRVSSGGNLLLGVSQQGGNTAYVNFATTSLYGNWHMITMTHYDSDSTNFYFDGTFKSHITMSSPTYTSSNLFFGAMVSGGSNGSYYPYQGYLDDIKIYNRPLTQAEIIYLSNH